MLNFERTTGYNERIINVQTLPLHLRLLQFCLILFDTEGVESTYN